jgi:hypothetical protein
MESAMRIASVIFGSVLLTGCAGMQSGMHAAVHGTAAAPATMIMVRQTAKTPDQAVDAIKAYAQSRKWVYMGANKVKPPAGEVTMVKVCIPAVAAVLWPLGLEMSAMLPCGNLGVYQKAGRTEISMLDPRYMSVLVSHPEVTRASGLALPQLTEMLDTVSK